MPKEVKPFPALKLIAWQKECGRNNLPWQATIDPYLRWLAEIMLQQTQVEAVKPYYENFKRRFPTINDLAQASEDDVLSEWEGLGYYSRARNALKCARKIVDEYGGVFPLSMEELVKLPGIGQSTAGAIISAVTDKPEVVCDGNVKRVFARFKAIDEIYGSPKFNKQVLEFALASLPKQDGRAYSQGLMDLGSMVCTRLEPKCLVCPVSSDCVAFNLGKTPLYPLKALKKTKPTKEFCWLIGLKDGKIFLERRKGKGVWTGLWCFPMVEKPPDDFLKELPAIQHEFTHFKLVAKPFVVVPAVAECFGGDWFDSGRSTKIGVPSPVRPLLEQLFQKGIEVPY